MATTSHNPEVCAASFRDRGDCAAPSTVHMLIGRMLADGSAADAYDESALPQAPGFCSMHAAEMRARVGGHLLGEHGWRRHGSACGIDGTVWHIEGNVCVPDRDGTEPDELTAALDRVAELAGVGQ